MTTFSGTTQSDGTNFVELGLTSNPSHPSFTGDLGELGGVDAGLHPELKYNGGKTPTIALEPNSPAKRRVGLDSPSVSQNEYEWQDFADIGAWGGPAISVHSITNLDGDEQSSIVRRLAVDFDTPVSLDLDAFAIESLSGGGEVTVRFTTETLVHNGATRAILTFSGSGTEFGSLVDGRYRLTVRRDHVRIGNGGRLDNDVVDEFHRMFGDVTGNSGVSDGSRSTRRLHVAAAGLCIEVRRRSLLHSLGFRR